MKWKRFNERMMIGLIIFIFVGVWPMGPACNQATKQKHEKGPDVLIIYSSGTPFKTISDMDAKDVDAVTTATPVGENCRTIAERLASILRDKKLAVRVAEASQIKHRNEILGARLVVIGSPAYFWNVSWQIKKLLDEQFSQIYVFSKERLAKRRIAAFAMAEIDSSARATLKAIKAVVGDCKGRFGPTMTFLTKHSKKEISRRINRFADQLEAVVDYN